MWKFSDKCSVSYMENVMWKQNWQRWIVAKWTREFFYSSAPHMRTKLSNQKITYKITGVDCLLVQPYINRLCMQLRYIPIYFIIKSRRKKVVGMEKIENSRG